MAYHVGSLVFDDWCSLRLDQGWSDTFVFKVSARSGLPPMDYARVIKRILPPLAKLRRGASVWVQVDAPGRWYANELRRALGRTACPVAITTDDTPPDSSLFSFTVRQGATPMPPPPRVQAVAGAKAAPRLGKSQTRVLQALARIQGGTAGEIASLAGLTEKTARTALEGLEILRLAEFMNRPPRKRPNKTARLRMKQRLAGWRRTRIGVRVIRPVCRPVPPVADILKGQLARLRRLRRKLFRSQPKRWWRITRPGKSLALRLWGIPSGISFQSGRERAYLPGWRHARTARLAPAWLRQDGQMEVLGGWSEVSVPGFRVVPDALVWARVQGDETLVWVEVQGGSRPKEMAAFLRRMRLRLRRACEYARLHRVRLVFLVLGKPWAVQALRQQPVELAHTEAVLLQNWLEYGKLPTILWGAMQSGSRL
jgi:hypothetical protein